MEIERLGYKNRLLRSKNRRHHRRLMRVRDLERSEPEAEIPIPAREREKGLEEELDLEMAKGLVLV